MNQPANISVCPGATVQATAFTSNPSGATFTWTNSNTAIGLGASGTGNVPAFMAVNTTLSPITAIITVVPTSTTGCSGIPVTYTITVNPTPSLTVTPANTTISAGGSVNLTASGGSNYTWTPSDGLSCTNCPNPVASPSSSTTYMVTATTTAGCSSSGYAVVSIAGTACASCQYTLAPGGTLSSNPVAGRSYCVNNSVLVTGNVTISNCELKMASNTQIVVTPGATLSIYGSHLYSCGNMWQGIQVLPGGKVVTNDAVISIWPSLVTKSTLIEDAFIAINVNGNSPVTSNLLNIHNTVFNRNEIGIKVVDYNQQLSTYPFSITKSVFTCRNLPFTPNSLVWPQTGTVSASNPSATPLTNQVINNATYSQTSAGAFLKAPMPVSTKSQKGLQLVNVGTTANASTTSPTYYEFSIGRALDVNIFDNVVIGADLASTNFLSVNNIYQNTGQKGIGISARADVTKNVRLQVLPVLTTVGANKFVDCGTAIRSANYFEHNVQFCDVRSPQINGNSASTRNGFNITTNRYRVCNILYNSMYNVANAVAINAQNGNYNVSGASQFGQYAGKINVDYNTIRPNLSGATVTTQYINTAIVLQNTGGVTQFANNITPVISTNANTIFASRGILYTNWIKQNIQSQNNNVTVLLNPLFFVGAPYYGINVNNCLEGSSNGNFIRSNTVKGFYVPTTDPNPSNDPDLTAIVTAISGRISVTCNNTSNTTRGIGFSGGNQFSLFKNNKMQDHRYGFFLDQNGVISQQGNATTPVDNQWLGTWLPGNFKTATIGGSIGQNSKMFVRSTGAYNPDGSTVAIGAPLGGVYSTSTTPSTLIALPIAPPIFDLSCVQIIPLPFLKKSLELIAEDSIAYSDDWSGMGEKMRYINKQMLYSSLKLDSVLTDSSSVLSDFYNEYSATAYETIHWINKHAEAGDLAEATLSNLGFNPENNIEENYKKYHEIFIRYLELDSCSTADSTDLRGLAEKCPFSEGSVIYKARALYNLIYETFETFRDYCPNLGESKSMIGKNGTQKRTDAIVLYPNPAKDEVFIAFDKQELSKVGIQVMDANGKIVYDNPHLEVRDGLATFTLNVNNGFYFVNVIDLNTHETTVEKLVIHQ